MKINAGDYVRTKDGYIRQLQAIMTGGYLHLEDFDCEYNYIIKSSPNIIDLIEVGDYVNGMQVTRICFDEDGERILNLSNCILELMNEDIKSVVTKEQFSAMEYRINE